MEKQPFYLIKRKLVSGKKVYYWYTYDKKGNRTVPKSTGKTSKNEAINYCYEKLSLSQLPIKNITFENYAKGWFEEGHEYLRKRMKPVKQSTLESKKGILRQVILPFFKNYKLTEISEDDIYNFLDYLDERKFSDTSKPVIIAVLKTMLNFACYKDYIKKSPYPEILVLQRGKSKREAFTKNEILYLFSKQWDKPKTEIFCLLSAITGMRYSEIAGLQLEQLKDNYILIDRQTYRDRITTTKTGEKRFVTLPNRFIKLLQNMGNEFFVFSSDRNIERPFQEHAIRIILYSQYSEEMTDRRKKFSLTFHSFRYFFNTYLMGNNVPQAKVDFVIGHSAGIGSMNRLYTTWKPEMYSDVLELQEKLLDELDFDNKFKDLIK